MEVKAKAKYLRVSPKKVRLVIDLIRGMDVDKALIQLDNLKKDAKEYVVKLLNSAIANAEHNYELERSNLYIKKIIADGGPILHRWRPRAHGRAGAIRKRTTHLTLVLDEREELKKDKKDAKKSVKRTKKTVKKADKKSKAGKEVKKEGLKKEKASNKSKSNK